MRWIGICALGLRIEGWGVAIGGLPTPYTRKSMHVEVYNTLLLQIVDMSHMWLPIIIDNCWAIITCFFTSFELVVFVSLSKTSIFIYFKNKHFKIFENIFWKQSRFFLNQMCFEMYVSIFGNKLTSYIKFVDIYFGSTKFCLKYFQNFLKGNQFLKL